MSQAPKRGDIVWLNFDPQIGREQAGRRPGLVLSPQAYNQRVGLALICPITNRVKGYDFEVALPAGAGASGVILSDHIKSLDWRGRDLHFVGSVGEDILEEVAHKLETLLFLE